MLTRPISYNPLVHHAGIMSESNHSPNQPQPTDS